MARVNAFFGQKREFLGAFAKFRKATSCFRHVCPSFRLLARKKIGTGRIFPKFDVLSIFPKSVEKIQVSLKSDKNNGYFT
jgi:hypothetical protein